MTTRSNLGEAFRYFSLWLVDQGMKPEDFEIVVHAPDQQTLNQIYVQLAAEEPTKLLPVRMSLPIPIVTTCLGMEIRYGLRQQDSPAGRKKGRNAKI